MNVILREGFDTYAQALFAYWAPRLAVALVIVVVFWLLARLADRALVRVGRLGHLNPLVISLLARSARLVLLGFGAVTALGTLGVNIAALVAGLGLTGFALGFALKDSISNVLAGVLLLIYRPFGINDRISVTNQEGTVIDIDLRYTTLEAEARRILIPNSVLFTNPIIVIRK